MVQMALQSRAVVPDGTVSVSSVFIILQGEERESDRTREGWGAVRDTRAHQRASICTDSPCWSLSPPLTSKSSSSLSLTSLHSFILLLSPAFSPAQREGKTPYCY